MYRLAWLSVRPLRQPRQSARDLPGSGARSIPRALVLKRLLALSARASLWSAEKAPLATVPSLYKSREDCLRDHPQVVRARKR